MSSLRTPAVLAAALILGLAASAGAQEPAAYVQLNVSDAFADLDSGGFNTLGPHFNTGDDDDDVLGLGGAVGLVLPSERFRLRLETEVTWRENMDFQTNSFPGPPGPITFFYDVKADNTWSSLANLWVDVPVGDWLMLYGGGGLGAAGAELKVNDGVVRGSRDQAEFAWQAGGGVVVVLTDSAELDLGYRYYDLGEYDVNLTSIGLAAPAGSYTADLESHEVMLSLRILVR